MDIVVTRYPVAQDNTVIFTGGLPLAANSHLHRWVGLIASSLLLRNTGGFERHRLTTTVSVDQNYDGIVSKALNHGWPITKEMTVRGEMIKVSVLYPRQ